MSLLMVRKSAPAHAAVNEFNRLVDSAKDAADAADAAEQFKVGDKIWVDPSYGANLNIGYGWNVGIVKRVGTGNIDVDFKGQVISVPAPYCAHVNSSGKPVFDSAAMDGRGDIRMTLHAAESQIAGVVNVFTKAQDRGNYATNTIALLRTALGNLRTAASVVHHPISNIDNAMSKVQDAQAKSSLKSMQQEWWACEREIWAVLEEIERVSVPSGVGVPNRQKLSPEDRKFIEEFFE